jgi:16S rRNA processing protein RimM
MADGLDAGRVGRPHGLDGSFYVTGARTRLLAPGTNIEIGGQLREVVRLAGVERRPIVRVRGVDDRAAAEALRGLAVSVPLAQAPALEPGEWWAHELEGCEVRSGERHVGAVRALLELPSCEVLEVGLPAGGELLVPMVKAAVLSVDVAARRIEVDLDFLGEVGPSEDAAGDEATSGDMASDGTASEEVASDDAASDDAASET